MRRFVLTGSAFFFSTQQAAAVPTDTNSDGRSEVVTVEASQDSSLLFRSQDLITNSIQELGSIGSLGDHIAAGSWITAGKTQLAVISAEAEGLIWKILNDESQIVAASFGETGDTVLSGADLNGDGLLEAISTSSATRKRTWKISSSLFTPDRSDSTLSFGFSNELPFYVHSQGRDLLALLSIGTRGQTVLRTFDTATGKARRIRLRRAPASTTPLPVRFTSTESGIVYVVGNSTSVQLFYHTLDSKSVVETGTIPSSGTVLVGDFLPEDGEEVAVHNNGKLLVHSRETDSITEFNVGSGIAVDEININSFTSASPPSNSPPSPSPPSLPPSPPSGPPAEGLTSVCASSSPILPGELLIKSDPSNHIGRHDPRTTGYTVVCARLCPSQLRYAQFFYSNGEFAGAVAKYGVFSGNGKPRLYGAVGDAPQHDARSIAAKAATIGNGKLYLQISGATSGSETSCKEFNPSGRNGSL